MAEAGHLEIACCKNAGRIHIEQQVNLSFSHPIKSYNHVAQSSRHTARTTSDIMQ